MSDAVRGSASPRPVLADSTPADVTLTNVIAVSGLAFEARIVAGPGVVSVCFARQALLAAAIEQAIARGCSGLISFGTMGGLAPDLQPGDWIVADAVVTGDRRFICDPVWMQALSQALLNVAKGTIIGVDEPLVDAAAKRALHANTGALAVDMESHVVARIAEHHGLPFVVCRVVVDPAWRSLPSCATVGTRADGTTQIGAILAELARHPAQLPALIRLAFDARRARAALVHGRALLGAKLRAP